MSTSSYIILGAMALCGIVIALVCFKTKHFIKNITLSAVSGIGSLFAVNLFTAYTGVSIAVNYITLLIGGFFGIPGIIGIVISQIVM